MPYARFATAQNTFGFMTPAQKSYFDYWPETIVFTAASAKLHGGGKVPVNILNLVRNIEG